MSEAHYKKLLVKELLSVEKKSQQLAGWILAVTIIVMNLFAQADSAPEMSDFLNFTRILSSVLVIWFMGISFLIAKNIYHPSFKYFNLILQISTVTFYMLVSARLVDAEFAMTSTAPLFYLLVIALTSMSLRPLFAILSGIFAAGQFVTAYYLWMSDESYSMHIGTSESAWIQVLLKCIVFVMMGIAAAVIARSSRRMLEKVVSVVSYEEKMKFVEEDLDQAAEIQNRLIPDGHFDTELFSIETYYCPAKQVGGDYFDVIPRPDGTCLVVIADVSGKGYAAALLMSNIQAIVTTLASQNYKLKEIVPIINQSVINTSVRGRFLTIALLQLDPVSQQIEYVNCGHNPPIVIHQNKEISLLGEAGPVLGVLENYMCDSNVIGFEAGDTLLAYTDGLSELRNQDGEQLGTDKIFEVLKMSAHLTPDYIKNFILNMIKGHTGDAELSDDLSFVCMQLKTEARLSQK